jgi:hypothetical protein
MYLSVGAGPFRDMMRGVRAWGTRGEVKGVGVLEEGKDKRREGRDRGEGRERVY